MTRIADDLASREPGGRNAAAYAAGLKAGSLLGAARATPGAEQAAAGWTDEAAEEALLDAADRNGYTGKDGQAEARRAIRSGLRNGLRSPAGPARLHRRPGPRRAPAIPPGRPRPSAARPVAADGRKTGRWQDMLPDDIRRQVEDADRAAGDSPPRRDHRAPAGPGTGTAGPATAATAACDVRADQGRGPRGA